MGTLEDSDGWQLDTARELTYRVRLSVDHLYRPGMRSIDIEVTGNTVVLSGMVGAYHERQLASAFAGRVAGVGKVLNQLEVRDGLTSDSLQQSSALRRQSRASDEADRRTP